MKYKVGDKVRVKDLEWYNEHKNKNGNIYCDDDMVFFTSGMSNFCGCILTIKNIDKDLDAYKVEENSYCWSNVMFEGLVEETIQPVVFKNIVFPNENYADKVELCLGNDYEIVVEDGKTFVQRKKPKYPKTYEECCGVLGMTFDYPDIRRVSSKEHYLYSSFFELIRCRDAYWKVADNWKPDWKDDSDKYFICYLKDEVCMSNIRECNRLLVFPTKEMRDAFFENFKDLIEKCKELL